MKCPNDGATLLMAERHSVEVDYCPDCRGIWLDRGELDKILEQVQPEPQQQAARESAERRDNSGRYGDDSPHGRYESDYGRGGADRRDNRDKYGDYGRRDDYDRRDSKYRKKSNPFELLGDIFGG